MFKKGRGITLHTAEAIRCIRLHGLENGVPAVHRLRPCCAPWLPQRAASLARISHNTRQAADQSAAFSRARSCRVAAARAQGGKAATRQLRRSKTTGLQKAQAQRDRDAQCEQQNKKELQR
jgi:hypothetical protein